MDSQHGMGILWTAGEVLDLASVHGKSPLEL